MTINAGAWLGRALPDWLVVAARYRRCHRRLPNLLRPTTFNEKVLHRILFDRRTWMTMVADKHRVRDHVARRLGEHLLPKLLWATDDPETIPFASLPERFVVKPSHGSGWVRVVHDKAALDRAELIRTCSLWLGRNYYDLTREWIYKDVPPRILIEEFIDDGSGGAPHDYKLFVFGGRVAFILVTMGRFGARAHMMLDRDWNPVDVTLAYSRERRAVPPPPHLREMIEAAEILGQDLEFVRVDFYDTAARLYFGEMTATPGCGLDRFEPESFDRTLGSFWPSGAGASAAATPPAEPIRASICTPTARQEPSTPCATSGAPLVPRVPAQSWTISIRPEASRSSPMTRQGGPDTATSSRSCP